MFGSLTVLSKLFERHKIEHFPIQYLVGVYKNGVSGLFIRENSDNIRFSIQYAFLQPFSPITVSLKTEKHKRVLGVPLSPHYLKVQLFIISHFFCLIALLTTIDSQNSALWFSCQSQVSLISYHADAFSSPTLLLLQEKVCRLGCWIQDVLCWIALSY